MLSGWASSPLSTASAAAGSAIAAWRVSSTWRTAASLSRCPSVRRQGTGLRGDRGDELAALPGQVAQRVALEQRLRLPQRLPELDDLVDELARDGVPGGSPPTRRRPDGAAPCTAVGQLPVPAGAGAPSRRRSGPR